MIDDRLGFTSQGWSEYTNWQTEDKKTLKKINKLIAEALRTPFDGLGHPEILRGDFAGCVSREIDGKNRLVYKVLDKGKIVVTLCKGHYKDN